MIIRYFPEEEIIDLCDDDLTMIPIENFRGNDEMIGIKVLDEEVHEIRKLDFSQENDKMKEHYSKYQNIINVGEI